MIKDKKLLDIVRGILRVKHYSYATEKTYIHWIKRFIFFHHKIHPNLMGEKEIGEFLTHLARENNVSASTQNQALNALVFLYKQVLNIELKKSQILHGQRNRPVFLLCSLKKK